RSGPRRTGRLFGRHNSTTPQPRLRARLTAERTRAPMRKGIFTLAAGAAALSLGLTACGGDSGETSAQGGDAPSASAAAKPGKIGVILPDSKSSARWETADRKYLTEAFQAAGVEFDIQNAQGDKNQFQTIA